MKHDKRGREIPENRDEVHVGMEVVMIKSFERMPLSKSPRGNHAVIVAIFPDDDDDYSVELYFPNRVSGYLHEAEYADKHEKALENKFYEVSFGWFAIAAPPAPMKPMKLPKCFLCKANSALLFDTCGSCIRSLVDKQKVNA